MRQVLAMPSAELERWRWLAQERVRERYSWDAVTTSYERLLIGLIGE
jgi:hypothetical protein